MKKWLIIVVSFAVTLALLLCLTPVLRELEMKLAYLKDVPPTYNVKLSDVTVDSYGTYNGCTVAFVYRVWHGTVINGEWVGNYHFNYSTWDTLKAFKDGTYKSLRDAYAAGWLNNDDVKKIHELHKQNFPFMY